MSLYKHVCVLIGFNLGTFGHWLLLHPGKCSSSKRGSERQMGELEQQRETVWGKGTRRECLVRYAAFIQQTLGGHMTDEVCTTNVTETMGDYLQFKVWMGLHYDLAFNTRVHVETQVNPRQENGGFWIQWSTKTLICRWKTKVYRS